jgi:HPt (histidine-containing phosphotransfer) domain-containing protein
VEETLYDLSTLQDLSSGNPEFVDKLVKMFIDLTPSLIERIELGLKEKNYAEVGAAAHKLKPSIDVMGIRSLKDTVREIEIYAKEQTQLDQLDDLFNALKNTLEKVFQQLRNR